MKSLFPGKPHLRHQTNFWTLLSSGPIIRTLGLCFFFESRLLLRQSSARRQHVDTPITHTEAGGHTPLCNP